MPNNDYILRSNAIKAFEDAVPDVIDDLTENMGYSCPNVEKIVGSIPAADVELKREIVPWKVAGTFNDFYQCIKCGNMWPIFSTVEWAYCPVCGCRKFPDPPKSWMDNPWCNAVDKALESEPPKED